jgi:hypothetical protein
MSCSSNPTVLVELTTSHSMKRAIACGFDDDDDDCNNDDFRKLAVMLYSRNLTYHHPHFTIDTSVMYIASKFY